MIPLKSPIEQQCNDDKLASSIVILMNVTFSRTPVIAVTSIDAIHYCRASCNFCSKPSPGMLFHNPRERGMNLKFSDLLLPVFLWKDISQYTLFNLHLQICSFHTDFGTISQLQISASISNRYRVCRFLPTKIFLAPDIWEAAGWNTNVLNFVSLVTKCMIQIPSKVDFESTHISSVTQIATILLETEKKYWKGRFLSIFAAKSEKLRFLEGQSRSVYKIDGASLRHYSIFYLYPSADTTI